LIAAGQESKKARKMGRMAPIVASPLDGTMISNHHNARGLSFCVWISVSVRYIASFWFYEDTSTLELIYDF